MIWVTLAASLICTVISIGTACLLVQLLRHMRERNRQLAANTEELRKHNVLLSAVTDLMIALYPDHDHPEQPSRQHKIFAIERVREAKSAIVTPIIFPGTR